MKPKYYLDDVPQLMRETENLYARITAKRPDTDKISLTKQKIIEQRGWAPTLSYYSKNFDQVLQDLKFFYVPKNMEPGPLFVFPIHDVDGSFSCAQTKPIEGSVLFGTAKYRYIGGKPSGPRWLGNDPATIKKIIDKQFVILIEGAFDLLACRLLCPELPIMSPLTKYIGKHHIAYLRMLGVKRGYLMYDNEEAKDDKHEDGSGNISMKAQVAQIKSIKLQEAHCPASDPSEALCYPAMAKQLRDRLRVLI